MKKGVLCETISLLSLLLGLGIYRYINSFHLVRNYLPDFLWAFAFMFALVPLLKNVFSKKYLVISSVLCFLCGTLFEIFQYFDIVKGTGDIFDVFIYILAVIFSFNITKKIYKRGEQK